MIANLVRKEPLLVGKLAQLVHATLLGCEFDELVGRGGDAAVG